MDASESPAAFWDRRYEAVDRLWQQAPNVFLAEFAASLAPGRALDVGAGEGRNAIWLAQRGWHVTALDVSAVALGRAEERADAEAVAIECVAGDWREHRLAPASFELVVISFMHPELTERAAMFERARAALVGGGHLFVVGVDLTDHGRRGPPDPERLYTPERLRAALAGFDLLRCESVAHEAERDDDLGQVVDVVAIAAAPAILAQ